METGDDPPKSQGTSPEAEAKEQEGGEEDASATSEGEKCDQSSESSEDAQATDGSNLEIIGETNEGAEQGQAIATAERSQAEGEEDIVTYEGTMGSPGREEKDEREQIVEVGQLRAGGSVATVPYEDSANQRIGRCEIGGYVVRPDFLEGQDRRSVEVGQIASMDTAADTITLNKLAPDEENRKFTNRWTKIAEGTQKEWIMSPDLEPPVEGAKSESWVLTDASAYMKENALKYLGSSELGTLWQLYINVGEEVVEMAAARAIARGAIPNAKICERLRGRTRRKKSRTRPTE